MSLKFISKLFLNGSIVALLLYWYTEIRIELAAIVAVLFVIVAWLLGDQLILRSSNNAVATFADGVLSIIYLWIVGEVLDLSLAFSEILVISATVAFAEWIFHRYILKPDSVMNA
jgi:hypothetical protein